MIKEYFNKEICKNCGGDCCKRSPGICIPKDIIKMFPSNSLEDSIKLALNSGNFNIDYYEPKYKNLFYIRPATLDSRGKIIDASWGGRCVFYNMTIGCKLSDNERPYGCRILEPDKGLNCQAHLPDNYKKYFGRIWKNTKLDLFEIGRNLK